jgi:hypothetical protein
MEDYSAIKSYLEKNNLNYFTSSPNSKKPIKAVFCYLPPYTSGEDIGFYVISIRQMMAIQTTHNGQTPMVTLPLFIVTLQRNIKS